MFLVILASSMKPRDHNYQKLVQMYFLFIYYTKQYYETNVSLWLSNKKKIFNLEAQSSSSSH